MDRVDKATRSRTMSKVRAKGSRIEKQLVDALSFAGLDDFILHASDVRGKPDVVFPNQKVAIFIDSCFWHGCPLHLRMPKSNTEYWEWKIQYNQDRDRKRTEELIGQGWSVIRVWEHELQEEGYIQRIQEVIGEVPLV